MNHANPNQVNRMTVAMVSFLLLVPASVRSAELSPREMGVWTQIYNDLHPDTEPQWPNGDT